MRSDPQSNSISTRINQSYITYCVKLYYANRCSTKNGINKINFTKKISVEGVLDHIHGDLGGGADALDSGIIDDDVDAAEVLKDRGERVAHAVVVGDVELLQEEVGIVLQIGDG